MNKKTDYDIYHDVKIEIPTEPVFLDKIISMIDEYRIRTGRDPLGIMLGYEIYWKVRAEFAAYCKQLTTDLNRTKMESIGGIKIQILSEPSIMCLGIDQSQSLTLYDLLHRKVEGMPA